MRKREASQLTHGLNAGGTELPSAEMGGCGDTGLSDRKDSHHGRAKPGPPGLSPPRSSGTSLCQMPNLMVVPLLGDEEVQREEAEEDSDGSEGRGS